MQHQAPGRSQGIRFRSWPRTLLAWPVLLSLAACGSLRPVPPKETRTSFRTTVEASQPAAPVRADVTLDDVKAAFGSLFASTRKTSSQKLAQQWTYTEIATAAGFMALVGQVVGKPDVLNWALGIGSAGLAASQLYDPGRTKDTHLAAEEMFVCMNAELGRVNEATRKLALRSSDGKGAAAAQTAIDDVIARIDEAVFAYRKKVMTQASAAPTKADFGRFAKEYAKQEEEAEQKQEESASDKAAALVDLDQQEVVLNNAKANRDSPAMAKQVQLAEARMAQIAREIRQADAMAAAAKFIPLQTRLEKCVQDFRD